MCGYGTERWLEVVRLAEREMTGYSVGYDVTKWEEFIVAGYPRSCSITNET